MAGLPLHHGVTERIRISGVRAMSRRETARRRPAEIVPVVVPQVGPRIEAPSAPRGGQRSLLAWMSMSQWVPFRCRASPSVSPTIFRQLRQVVEVAGRGERHSIASPDKQLGSQKSLQLANISADGAGRDPQFGRRRTGNSRAGPPLRMPGASSAAEAAHWTCISGTGEASEKLSQTRIIAGHGQSRDAATSVRIARNCRQTAGRRPSGHRKPKPARRGRRIGRCPGGPSDDVRIRRAGGSSRVERRRTIPARAVGLSSAGCACAVRSLPRNFAMFRTGPGAGGLSIIHT